MTAGLLGVFAIQLRGRMRTSGGPGAQGVPVAIGVTALGLLIAGLFSTMPAFGYPPGTPDGFPADIPPSAYLHVLGAFLFFGGMIAAPALMARRFLVSGATAWAVYSVVTALVVAVAFAASSAEGAAGRSCRRPPDSCNASPSWRASRGSPGWRPWRPSAPDGPPEGSPPTGVDARGYMGCSPLSRFPAPAPLTPVEVTCP